MARMWDTKEMRNEVRKDGEQELGKGKVSKRDSKSSGVLMSREVG